MIKIKWWKQLSWEINIPWSKNASLPIIASALLIKGKVILKNVPNIWDVNTFLEILLWIWVKYKFESWTLELDSTNLKEADFDLEKIKKIRVSILLLAPLLNRLWSINIPTPWGCNLWKRSIDWHLNWLKDIGYDVLESWKEIKLYWKQKTWDLEINAWFWVTVSENLIVSNVLRQWKTVIRFSAIEPHVINLIDFLRAAWADISIRYDNTIIINWVDSLKSDFSFDVISDYLQSGTYMIIWALVSRDYLTIKNARIRDLYFFIEKLKEAWVKIELDLEKDIVKVYKSDYLKPVLIQTNIFPWFPTDLQSPFAVLMTQADWKSSIFEVLFEWRLSWLVELEKMWVNIDIINHHEAVINWWKQLKAAKVTSWDLRAGAAMVIAWLIASWKTIIWNVEYIHRWYENLIENLSALWADIEEVKS